MANKINEDTINLIKSFEGFSDKAYHDTIDPVNVDTIGYGTVAYPNGKKVKVDDPDITQEQAVEYLMFEVNQKAKVITPMIHTSLNDNQFGALVSFAYNLGEGSLSSSTLLKKVNANPKDLTIKDEFLKWNHSCGKVVDGLTRRRLSEWELYNSAVKNIQ